VKKATYVGPEWLAGEATRPTLLQSAAIKCGMALVRGNSNPGPMKPGVPRPKFPPQVPPDTVPRRLGSFAPWCLAEPFSPASRSTRRLSGGEFVFDDFGLPFELSSCAEPLSAWLSGVRLIRGAEGSRSAAAAAPATAALQDSRVRGPSRR